MSQENESYRITIIGGGIIGLTTACTLLKEYLNDERLQLTIISENFSPNTTADVSAGYWGPYGFEKFDDRIRYWSAYTYQIFFEEFLSNKAPQSGIVKMPTYLLQWYKEDDNHRALPPFRNIVQDFRVLDEDAMKIFQHANPPVGFAMTSIVVEPSKYLPQLTRFLAQDSRVKFSQNKIHSFDELKAKADVIINCTGLQSRFLTSDTNIRPARGQVVFMLHYFFSYLLFIRMFFLLTYRKKVVRVHAPWIKCAYNFELNQESGYIIPQSDCVILGGTFQLDDWNINVDNDDTMKIIDLCSKLFPNIRDVPIIRVDAGLRPYRDGGVRLEYERTPTGQDIVHCYGHSGAGVTLSWGCARDVVDIVNKLLPPKRRMNYNCPEHETLWRLILQDKEDCQ